MLGSGLAKKRLQAFKQSKVKFTRQHETVHNNFEIVFAARAFSSTLKIGATIRLKIDTGRTGTYLNDLLRRLLIFW